MERIECPSCKTSYTVDRLGLGAFVAKDRPFTATVVCVLCKAAFDAHYSIETVTGARTWRTLWRRTDAKQPVMRTLLRSE